MPAQAGIQAIEFTGFRRTPDLEVNIFRVPLKQSYTSRSTPQVFDAQLTPQPACVVGHPTGFPRASGVHFFKILQQRDEAFASCEIARRLARRFSPEDWKPVVEPFAVMARQQSLLDLALEFTGQDASRRLDCIARFR
ncbi:MAG TPA: hypothetical protein VHQ88_18065, partial [Burkholderiales bacterium]|nr:hypothetical protein [Burkholderiales bacterium]